VTRRLPVIQTSVGEDAEAAERPGWQWVLIGGAFVWAVFFPLSMLAVPLGVRLVRPEAQSFAVNALLAALPVLAVFALSAWAAGAVVGRFGLRAKRWAAPSAGALGAAAILALALLRGGLGGSVALIAMSVLLIGTGALFARLGARFGERRRPGVAAR
jgi:hypothetical protein